MTIKKALLTIKGYCEKHINCNKCQLSNEDGYCFFSRNIPIEWDVDEMLKKRTGDPDDSD